MGQNTSPASAEHRLQDACMLIDSQACARDFGLLGCSSPSSAKQRGAKVTFLGDFWRRMSSRRLLLGRFVHPIRERQRPSINHGFASVGELPEGPLFFPRDL